MSDVIKLSSKKNNSSVKVAKIGNTSFKDDEGDIFKKQLEDYYKLGFNDGQEKTRRELEQDFTNKLFKKYDEVYNILTQYDEHLIEMEKGFEYLVIETAYELAKKIIGREVERENIINENVRQAINKIVGANNVKLKLNPKDLEELTEASKNLIHSSSFTKIKIEPDERIERGGCFIETEIGNVDARITTQLNELRKKLEDSLE
ncbi:MAG: FliH/SctL family protein [Stygiobacter sp.]|jgi:flagellar assembly protein FliH|uniref:Flagellar assembly protein FliH n=1 Tax=Stygiobacter electus TaxID=3032292 RepID=A0AAE3TBG6_9BACT|nr:FliH/SctL family protein [Stygiobacter electus]MDF1611263.1 FliH/SctL family protein [Stygiobacter electus]